LAISLNRQSKTPFGGRIPARIIPGHGGLRPIVDGFVAAIVLAALIGILRGGVDASAAVLWFGEDMTLVPLRNNKAAASLCVP